MANKVHGYGRDAGLSLRMFTTMLLLAALYLAFIVVLYALHLSMGFLLFIVIIVGIGQYYLSDQLVLWSMGSKPLSPGQAPELYQIVERLAQVADLPKPKLAYVGSGMPNAFTTGRKPATSVITVTQGLLRTLNTQELEAVLAHEMTHIKNRDVTVITLASFFATVASFLSQQLLWLGLGFDQNRRDRGGASAGLIIWGVSLLVWAISYVLIRTLSRYREYAADRGSAVLTGHPSHLASALQKISSGMRRTPKMDLRQAEGFNAFFIIPAIRSDSLMELLSTHPSLEHRLQYLEKMAEEMER